MVTVRASRLQVSASSRTLAFHALEDEILRTERELRERTWDIPERDLVPRLRALDAESHRRVLLADSARLATVRRSGLMQRR